MCGKRRFYRWPLVKKTTGACQLIGQQTWSAIEHATNATEQHFQLFDGVSAIRWLRLIRQNPPVGNERQDNHLVLSFPLSNLSFTGDWSVDIQIEAVLALIAQVRQQAAQVLQSAAGDEPERFAFVANVR